jgi:hypothetical protein
LTDVSEVLTAFIIALMTEALSTSEASVNIYQTTRHSIPEDSHCRRQNLKFQLENVSFEHIFEAPCGKCCY